MESKISSNNFRLIDTATGTTEISIPDWADEIIVHISGLSGAVNFSIPFCKAQLANSFVSYDMGYYQNATSHDLAIIQIKKTAVKLNYHSNSGTVETNSTIVKVYGR